MKSKKPKNSRRDFLIKGATVLPALALGGVAMNSMVAPEAKAAEKDGKASAAASRDYQPTFLRKKNLTLSRLFPAALFLRISLGPVLWKPGCLNL